MNRSILATAVAAVSFGVVSMASAAISMSPLTTFGGDGWLAPLEQPYVTTGNSQRSMAYNAATGNLLLANDLSVRVLNASTGASVALLDVTGVSGGARALNTVGATTDGVIYATNLTTQSTTSPFKVYRWSDQSALPTVAYSGNAGLGGARVGDNLAVFGADASGAMAAGFSNNPNVAGNNSFSKLTTGVAPVATAISLAGTPPVAGDFRLGITFADANTVLGTQGQAAANGLRVVSVSGSTGTLLDTSILGSASERGLGYAVVGGLPLLGTIDTGSSLVRVYNMTDINNPALLLSGNLTSGTLSANGNGSAAIAWGNISGNTATLYAMSTNQGIQAFTVVVPEPSALGLLVPAGLMMVRRRRA